MTLDIALVLLIPALGPLSIAGLLIHAAYRRLTQ